MRHLHFEISSTEGILPPPLLGGSSLTDPNFSPCSSSPGVFYIWQQQKDMNKILVESEDSPPGAWPWIYPQGQSSFRTRKVMLFRNDWFLPRGGNQLQTDPSQAVSLGWALEHSLILCQQRGVAQLICNTGTNPIFSPPPPTHVPWAQTYTKVLTL